MRSAKSGTATSEETVPMAPATDLVIGAEAIAGFLGRSTDQIYYAMRNRRLPVFKFGGRLCARKSTLLAWIERSENEPRTPRR